MSKKYFVLLSMFAVCLSCYAQEIYSLDWMLQHYQTSKIFRSSQSDSIIYENNKKLFHTKVLPTVSMSATLPNINHNISPVVQPEGQEVFINRFYANSSMSLSVSQLLPFTGGTLSATTSLVRLDNFVPSRSVSYNLNLFNISYRQSLSGFNSYKWEKKQFDAECKLNDIQQIQVREDIYATIVSLFFNLYAAQEEYRILQESLILSEYLLQKAERLYNNKRISYEDYLDAKIECGRANIRLTKDNVNEARAQLSSYLDLNTESNFSVFFDERLMTPKEFCIDEEKIIENVLHYSAELEQEVSEINNTVKLKQIKSADIPSVSLSIGGGINSQANELSQILGQPNSQMNVSLSLSVPILNWEKNKLEYKNKEESVKIQSLNFQSKLEKLKIECHYDLSSVDGILMEIEEENNLIDMLLQKIEIIKLNLENGRLDFSDLSKIRTSLIKANMENIDRVSHLYSLIYKYRKAALIDIRTGENLSL